MPLGPSEVRMASATARQVRTVTAAGTPGHTSSGHNVGVPHSHRLLLVLYRMVRQLCGVVGLAHTLKALLPEFAAVMAVAMVALKCRFSLEGLS